LLAQVIEPPCRQVPAQQFARKLAFRAALFFRKLIEFTLELLSSSRIVKVAMASPLFAPRKTG
jgi:hypothetical protein